MVKKWIISDTHFQHKNVLEFEPTRPGNTIEEHDEILVERWNSRVKPGDKVYHLGDVFFGSRDTFKSLWPKLNGRKRLIVGNHDDIKFLSSGSFFDKITMWKHLKDERLILTHTPLHPETLQEDRWRHTKLINVHGHTHSKGSPEGPYKSACVELTNYCPVELEEYIEL